MTMPTQKSLELPDPGKINEPDPEPPDLSSSETREQREQLESQF